MMSQIFLIVGARSLLGTRVSRSLMSMWMLCGIHQACCSVWDYEQAVNAEDHTIASWSFHQPKAFKNLAPRSENGFENNLEAFYTPHFDTAPKLEFRADGFSPDSGAVITKRISDNEAVGIRLGGEAIFPMQCTIEIIFRQDKSDQAGGLILGYYAKEAGRFALLMRNAEGFFSALGTASVEKATSPTWFQPQTDHWYYVVFLLDFSTNDRVKLDVYLADLTGQDKKLRTMLADFSQPINARAFTAEGTYGFGLGMNGGGPDRYGPDTIFDQVTITDGLLSIEELNKRIEILLAP